MTPLELKNSIEGAKALRDDYAKRIKEIDRDIAGMEANYRRMTQTPVMVGS